MNNPILTDKFEIRCSYCGRPVSTSAGSRFGIEMNAVVTCSICFESDWISARKDFADMAEYIKELGSLESFLQVAKEMEERKKCGI